MCESAYNSGHEKKKGEGAGGEIKDKGLQDKEKDLQDGIPALGASKSPLGSNLHQEKLREVRRLLGDQEEAEDVGRPRRVRRHRVHPVQVRVLAGVGRQVVDPGGQTLEQRPPAHVAVDQDQPLTGRRRRIQSPANGVGAIGVTGVPLPKSEQV